MATETTRQQNVEITTAGDTTTVELQYPKQGPVEYIQIALSAVRAADDIRISYDFKRDGWKIEQAAEVVTDVGVYQVYDVQWQEVAFAQAWALEEDKE